MQLEVKRPGVTSTLTFDLERRKVKVPDVPYKGMLSETTGYLALNSFTKTASSEVRKALMHLTDSLGAENVVIDLRGNGGGLLREAIAMVNLFVGKGQEVVSTKGKTPDWNKSYKTRMSACDPTAPGNSGGWQVTWMKSWQGPFKIWIEALWSALNRLRKGLVQQPRNSLAAHA